MVATDEVAGGNDHRKRAARQCEASEVRGPEQRKALSPVEFTQRNIGHVDIVDRSRPGEAVPKVMGRR